MDYQQMEVKRIKITSSLIEQTIANCCGYQPNACTFDRLSEIPKLWRHSCPSTGIVNLKPQTINIYELIIVFTFCDKCGKINYYHDDFK